MKDEQPPLSELARLGRLTLAVGDEVYIGADANGLGGGPHVVTGVGAKYIRVRRAPDASGRLGVRERRFSRVTRCEASEGIGGYCIIYTPDERARVYRRASVMAKLAEATQRPSWMSEHSTETLEDVLRLLVRTPYAGGHDEPAK